MLAHLIDGLLQLAARLLIMLGELLVPSTVLYVHATGPLRGFLNDRRPRLGDFFIRILFVQPVLEGGPVGQTVDEFRGTVEEGE